MKHKKHNKIKRPDLGHFSRNEWSILGVSCSYISDIVQEIFESIDSKGVYVDASHDKNRSPLSHDQFTHHTSGFFESSFNGGFSPVEKHAQFGKYDYALINGNHFQAKKQLVFCHPDKHDSLQRRLSQLTDISAFVCLEKNWEIPEFLEELARTRPIIKTKKSLINFIKSNIELPELKALILLGGKSTRMGKDKGEIVYHEKPQKTHLYDLLGSILGEEKVYFSVGIDFQDESEYFVKDKFVDLGPTGGILSAFRKDPDAAWLVVANDIPMLDGSTLRNLIQHRNPSKVATSVKGENKEFMEPLISIYEPRAYQNLLSFLAQGYSCPRKMLINSEVEVFEVKDEIIINANSPEEMMAVKKGLKKDIHE